jgi:hypothetical protein
MSKTKRIKRTSNGRTTLRMRPKSKTRRNRVLRKQLIFEVVKSEGKDGALVGITFCCVDLGSVFTIARPFLAIGTQTGMTVASATEVAALEEIEGEVNPDNLHGWSFCPHCGSRIEFKYVELPAIPKKNN